MTAKKDDGNPFSKLAALRDALPLGEAPKADASAASTASTSSKASAALGGKVVVRKERAGRGGKTVTMVEGVRLQGEALEEFAREMKKALGCGAVVEGGAIALQGEQEDRAKAYLEKKGAAQVVMGTKKR